MVTYGQDSNYRVNEVEVNLSAKAPESPIFPFGTILNQLLLVLIDRFYKRSSQQLLTESVLLASFIWLSSLKYSQSCLCYHFVSYTLCVSIMMSVQPSLFQMADFSVWSKTVVQTDVKQTRSMASRSAAVLWERADNKCTQTYPVLAARGWGGWISSASSTIMNVHVTFDKRSPSLPTSRALSAWAKVVNTAVPLWQN